MNKVILEIRAGAGGDEAALFVGDLARMYQKYAARREWKFTLVDFHHTSLEGYKSLVAEIEGENVYNDLKQESGVHRVQRIPKTEKTGRIHTSTATVAVIPEVKPEKVQINASDLEVSFFRSSGPGGQHVNKVETAVRIIHKPTGLVVSSQAGRSQHANREMALNLLRAKLYDIKQQEEQTKLGALRKQQIGAAERPEKIRTYNFPQDRISDHRINKKWSRVEDILDGDLEPIIKAFKNFPAAQN
jgi:peptide chain release factor 1